MTHRPQYRTLELPADPLMDGETGIPALVNKLLAYFGKPTIPQTADLTEFRDSLQSMAEYIIPTMPRPSQKELADRTRRRRSGLPAIVAMSNKRPSVPQPSAPSAQALFNDRFRRAEELAQRRGISVAQAMQFIPQ